MIDPYNYMPASGHRGRWTAFMEPLRSRQVRFHILKKSHNSEGNAVLRKKGEETVMEAVKDYSVQFNVVEFEEGEFPKDPTIAATFESGELTDFLQAIVDCAYGLGITASKFEDRTKEIAAIKNHLEDMRTLAKVK